MLNAWIIKLVKVFLILRALFVHRKCSNVIVFNSSKLSIKIVSVSANLDTKCIEGGTNCRRISFTRIQWSINLQDNKMKKQSVSIVHLAVAAVLFIFVVPNASKAEQIKRGYRVCSENFSDNWSADAPSLNSRFIWGTCTVISGDDENGLEVLYDLANQHSHVSATFVIADYLGTDGRFALPRTEANINDAIEFYSRTVALIKSMSDYPGPDLGAYERNSQFELRSYSRIPLFYLKRYVLGVSGDAYRHLYRSPSYEGEKSEKTYPQYRDVTEDSLNKLIEHATECGYLPNKKHFDPALYEFVINNCNLKREIGLKLQPLEVRRQQILEQEQCQDLNQKNCPEYFETHEQIRKLRDNLDKKVEKLRKKILL